MRIRNDEVEVKLVPKRSSRLTIIIVVAAIVFSVVALVVIHAATQNILAEGDAWRSEAQIQEQEKSRWEELFDRLGTLEGIKDIAENLLGLTDPDTVIIEPEK